MTQYIKFFSTKEEAESFAKSVNSESWGWMKNKAGKITQWYVEW